MLVAFQVSNFLSIGKMLKFSMETGKVRQKMEHVSRDRKCSLLKFSAIYGANASGKSAIVRAMDFSQSVILGKKQRHIADYYCRTKPENKDKTSFFEYEVKLDKKIYQYGFEILLNNRSIRNEWLSITGDGDINEKIFERDLESGKSTIYESAVGKVDADVLNLFINNIKTDDTQLFLTEMNRSKKDFYIEHPKIAFLQKIYSWFEKSLEINYPKEGMYPTLLLNDQNREVANILLQDMDLGFTKLQVKECSIDELRQYIPSECLDKFIEHLKENAIKQRNAGEEGPHGAIVQGKTGEFFVITISPESIDTVTIKKIMTVHTGSAGEFALNEESDGTRRIINLIEIVISAKLGANKTFVIDEIDRCLHPMLTEKLIRSYLTAIPGKNHIQLIVTTHEVSLLKNNLLRHDEIRFVTKNDKDSTILTSLGEIGVRTDKKIITAYLNGDYGGIPKFASEQNQNGDCVIEAQDNTTKEEAT